MAPLRTLIRHLWLDADDARRLIGATVLDRLTQRTRAAERGHAGEIRLCIEASLPMSYLRRVGPHCTLADVTRERAVMMFSKLRVWDTANNSGVLLYVLLAEHAIEIVADRGLNQQVQPEHWTSLVADLASSFRESLYEEGLNQAVNEIYQVLVQHFGADDSLGANVNELPDSPAIL